MEDASASKFIPHQIGEVQNDVLRFGLDGIKGDIVGSHPLQSTRRMEEAMCKVNLYGTAFPPKEELNKQILSRFQRHPGPIPSSMLGLEAVTVLGATILLARGVKMKNWSKESCRWLSKIARSRADFHKNVAAKHNNSVIMNRQFGSTVSGGNKVDLHQLTRDFLVKLWVNDRKMRNPRGKKLVKSFGGYGDPRWFSASSGVAKRRKQQVVLKQPPISQSVSDFFDLKSPQEAKVAPLLARSNLLITRDIEWANLVLGFEQENRYAIVDACYPQSPVGFIREQSNLITRQLLRLRRPFVAYITDALGNELFRVRRPFWWITSSIYAEIDGKEVGVVHRRWHLWRRIYDLYLGNKQFAVVENPGLWNWTFTLKDINGEVLAQIDRDWRGFGFEILTDAGQYVIRFGSSDPSSKIGLATAIEDLEVSRTLTLAERAVTVALAISLDNDYFSRHGGWGLPFLVAEE